MKQFGILLTYLLLAGCSYEPDQRVVGHFVAENADALDVNKDGIITYTKKKKEEFVGLVTIGKEDPITIRVIAPDTSPFIGTVISFSSDRTAITVQWSTWQHSEEKHERATEFRKE